MISYRLWEKTVAPKRASSRYDGVTFVRQASSLSRAGTLSSRPGHLPLLAHGEALVPEGKARLPAGLLERDRHQELEGPVAGHAVVNPEQACSGVVIPVAIGSEVAPSSDKPMHSLVPRHPGAQRVRAASESVHKHYASC